MKKIIALALALIMLLGALTACGKKDDGETPNTVASTVAHPEDGLPNVDMNGFELSMLTYNDEWFNWAEIAIDVDTYEANMVSEEIYKRNLSIEERFNCYLNVMSEKEIDKSDIETMAMSGDSNVHIVMYYDKWVINSAQYFTDWDNVDYIDLSAEYWNPGITQMFDINGKQIAISGAFSLGMLSRTETVLFDKQMYADLSANDETMYDTMYEYVDNDEWTLETLYKIAQMAVKSDDEVWDENDMYGISASKKELYNSLIIGMGVRFIEKNKEGTPEFTLTSNQAYIDKLQKLLQLNQNNDIHYDTSNNAHYADPEDFFEDGHTFFAIRTIFGIPKARQVMTQEFGILPVPKYDKDQTQYYSACFGGDMACLMSTVPEDKYENIGIILEAMAFHSNENLIPTYKTELLQTRYASDIESSQMLDIIFETTYSDMGITALEDTVSLYLVSQVFAKKNSTTLMSELAVMEQGIPSELKLMVKNIK